MTEFTTWRSLVDGAEISAIPDSVVERPEDDGTGQTRQTSGVIFKSTEEWPEIGAKVSANEDDDANVAEVYRIEDDDSTTLIGQLEETDIKAGFEFSVELDEPVDTEHEHLIGIRRDDFEVYTRGRNQNVEYPIFSDDDVLELVEGGRVDDNGSLSRDGGDTQSIVKIGAVGFD